MEAMMFVVAILGCGDDPASACREARLLPARYATAAQCRAALPQMLAQNTDVSAPSISAACRRQGAQMAWLEPRRGR